MTSVCLACYNGEKHIKEQIESILIQLDPSDELIISDDSSIDDTILIVKSIRDKRIKLYINEKPSGRPTENFQNALRKAKGTFVFLSDQDDIWIAAKHE